MPVRLFFRAAICLALALVFTFTGLAAAPQGVAATPPSLGDQADLAAWGELNELGDGWVSSSWYGNFNTSLYPWIFHAQHGFQWTQTEAGGAFYFFDMELGWLFTRPNVYPDVYAFALGGSATWMSYLAGSAQPRLFYRYDTAAWFSVPAEVAPASYVAIAPGTYLRGSPEDEPGRWDDESPQHQVTLTRGFAMQTTEVTNAQFADVMNWALGQGLVAATATTVENLTGDPRQLYNLIDTSSQLSVENGQLVADGGLENYPVIQVTWYGAMAYCHYLSLREGLSPAVDLSDWSVDLEAAGYRLPTEAEWEYACRAGTTTAFANGPITHLETDPVDPNLNAMGWYVGNAQNPENDLSDGLGTHPVGGKQPNAWGLYDMHGNVWEWCSDYNAPYTAQALVDPESPSFFSTERILRGGGFLDLARGCRSAVRWWFAPDTTDAAFGFRPVRTQVP